MSEARRAKPSLTFNGKNVTTKLADYLESLSYTDVASGTSDSLSLDLHNIGQIWLTQWYPTKGSVIKGSISFTDWNKDGENLSLSCGTFILDEVKFTGGPLSLSLGALAIPASESFKSRERTKTWKKVTIRQIAAEIAKRYKLKLSYSGPTISISSMEQSKKADCPFLYEVCDKYGLAMKVYNSKIVIYDHKAAEAKKAVAKISYDSFIDDQWEYRDALEGTYTGARISYKNPKKDSKNKKEKDISIYLGLKAENAKGSRVLKINETCDNQADAYYKAAAKVNEANRQATVLSGTMWANPKICAGVCVTVTGMGKADGKYYVDEVTTEIGASGTTQKVEMHRCQPQLTYGAKKKTTKKKTTKKKSSSSNFKVGDVVNFHGGTHYVSSYSGAKGYPARAGKAKITLGPNCAGNGKAHPWHLIHTDGGSNVYGWVDSGTFSK